MTLAFIESVVTLSMLANACIMVTLAQQGGISAKG